MTCLPGDQAYREIKKNLVVSKVSKSSKRSGQTTIFSDFAHLIVAVLPGAAMAPTLRPL
jgi:hypothetical protein